VVNILVRHVFDGVEGHHSLGMSSNQRNKQLNVSAIFEFSNLLSLTRKLKNSVKTESSKIKTKINLAIKLHELEMLRIVKKEIIL